MFDLENLSYEEKKAVEELRLRVENELEPDMAEDVTLCYRFLKARDFDVDKAEKMLRKHMIWRKARQVSTFLEDFVPTEVFLKIIEPSFIGFDKKGDLVQYIPMGEIDGREILKCMRMNHYLKHWIWFSEKSKATIRKLKEEMGENGKHIAQISLLINLDKLSFSNATSKASSEILMRIMQLLQDNYPEGMKSLCVINAPRYYVFIFSILKAMMSNAMMQKIHVFGQDGWKDALLKEIDADVLPAFLGGNRTDPDGNPLCKTFVTNGTKIPSCYFMLDEDRYFRDKSQVIKMFIPKSGKKEVYVDVKEKGSVIQWEFLVKNKDIGFGLFYEKAEITEVLPIQRYDTFDGTEIGSYRTKLAGKYIIMFDNSYSWLSSKEIEYSVKVIKRGQ